MGKSGTVPRRINCVAIPNCHPWRSYFNNAQTDFARFCKASPWVGKARPYNYFQKLDSKKDGLRAASLAPSLKPEKVLVAYLALMDIEYKTSLFLLEGR